MASYTLEHKQIAFMVFRKHGEIQATLKELRKDSRFKGINKTTILAWANKRDANGKIWKDRLGEIEKVANDLLDLDLAKERNQTVKNLMELKSYIFNKTLATDVKSAEGGAKAYAILTQTLGELTGTDIREEILRQMSEAIFAAIAVHPVVGPVLKEYWEEIKPKIETNFKRMNKK